MRLASVLFLLLLQACGNSPSCDISNGLPAANAGCFVAQGNQVLVARQRNGLVNIPGGTSAGGEYAECTAARETLEETGLQVDVGQLLKVYPNGFHLFRCTDRGDGVLGPLDALEVDSAFWVAEQDFDAQNWRLNHG